MRRDGSFDELLRRGLLAAAQEDGRQGSETMKLSPSYCAWRRAFLQNPFRAARRRPRQEMRAAACLCIFLAGVVTAASITLSWPALLRWVTGQEPLSDAETVPPETPPQPDSALPPPAETDPAEDVVWSHYTVETDGAGADFETKRELARQLEELPDTQVFGFHGLRTLPGGEGLRAIEMDARLLEELSSMVILGTDLQETEPGVISCWVGNAYGARFKPGDSFQAYLLGASYRFEVAGVLSAGVMVERNGYGYYDVDDTVILLYPTDTEDQCEQKLRDTYISSAQLSEAEALLDASGLEAELAGAPGGVTVHMGGTKGMYVNVYDRSASDRDYNRELHDEKLYQPLVQLDAAFRELGSREVVQMPVTVWGYYEGGTRFVAGPQANNIAWTDEDGSNVYTTELKTVRLDAVTMEELAGENAPPAEAYAISKDAKTLPCLLGSGYEGVYKVGDSFQADLSGVRTYDLEITGFLPPGALVITGNGEVEVETVLDDYIILPSFHYTDDPDTLDDYYAMNWFYALKIFYYYAPAPRVREAGAILVGTDLPNFDFPYCLGNLWGRVQGVVK